jgi:hypothetical protein
LAQDLAGVSLCVIDVQELNDRAFLAIALELEGIAEIELVFYIEHARGLSIENFPWSAVAKGNADF